MQKYTVPYFIKLAIKPIVSAFMLSSALSISSCSLFSVYQIDLAQGTPITQTQAQKIQVGMSQGQVLYQLGTPALRDTLAPNRWDYIFDYVPGTDGAREGEVAIQNASRHFVVYFDNAGLVTSTEGVETLPLSN